MADTDLVPDDGITAGSRTTPRNVLELRQAAATARELLAGARGPRVAGRRRDARGPGRRDHEPVGTDDDATPTWRRPGTRSRPSAQTIRPDVALTPVNGWQALGRPVARPNARDLVTGAHRFPSDVVRPGMLYGRVLRPPAYGATLESVDLSAAKAMDGRGRGSRRAVRRLRGAVLAPRDAGARRGRPHGLLEDVAPARLEREPVRAPARARAPGRGAHRREGLDRDGAAEGGPGPRRSPIASPSSSTPRWSPAPRWPSGTGTA